MPGKIVSSEEWLSERRSLLAQEKAALRANDALNAQLRDFPMVKLDKDYTFDGTNGKAKLVDLFEGRKQLIIYHFMLAPEYDAGCSGCSFFADNLPKTQAHLNYRDTTLALVSRAPLTKIQAFKSRMGWDYPWYSSFETDFNKDFNVTLEENSRYNFQDKKEVSKDANVPTEGEAPGLSVFLKDGDTIYHTYSTYARGLDTFLVTHRLLDVTPLGRQDAKGVDWKLHDEY